MSQHLIYPFPETPWLPEAARGPAPCSRRVTTPAGPARHASPAATLRRFALQVQLGFALVLGLSALMLVLHG